MLCHASCWEHCWHHKESSQQALMLHHLSPTPALHSADWSHWKQYAQINCPWRKLPCFRWDHHWSDIRNTVQFASPSACKIPCNLCQCLVNWCSAPHPSVDLSRTVCWSISLTDLFPHLHFSAGTQKKQLTDFCKVSEPGTGTEVESCAYKTGSTLGWDDEMLESTEWGRAILNVYEHLRSKQTGLTVFVVCTSPQCDSCASQQPKERMPFFPPLFLHWKWQYNDHLERTHANLTKTQSVKDQRKNRSHEPNHQNLLLTPLRLRRGTPKKHFHLKARQRHCMWHKKNSKTHEALTCERNMLQLCQILLFIFY